MRVRSKLFFLLVVGIALMTSALLYYHGRQPSQAPLTATPAPVPDGASRQEQSASAVASSTGSPANINLEPLSSAIRPIVDEQADYTARLSATQIVTTTNLTDADRQALYAFLLQRSPLDDGQPGHVLKNQLLDAFCGLNPPPAGLGDVLVHMYRDRNQDMVLRDYAVQHMVARYEQIERVEEADRRTLSGEQTQLRDVLWEATGEMESSIAGTALLGLDHLSEGRGDPEFDQNRVAASALLLSEKGAAGELTRITAFQVCARLGVQDALPLLEQSAAQGDSIPLRISAIGALGTLGNVKAVPLLRSLLEGTEERLKPPARQALAQIERTGYRARAGNNLR